MFQADSFGLPLAGLRHTTMKQVKHLIVSSLVVSLLLSARQSATATTLLSDESDKVDQLFQKWNKPDSPGCALAIIDHGKTIYKRGYGMADLDHSIPNSPETVFHVGSISKQFTAMTIALLAQQGTLALDDDIRKFLPELPVYRNPITIRNLLQHTSGLREHQDLLWLAGWRTEDVETEADIVKLISRQKELTFNPGEQFGYSNTNYTLLAVIAERATRQSFRDLVEAMILRPLGMTSSIVRSDHALIVKNRAFGYLPRYEGGYGISNFNFEFAGSTNLNTTVEDMSRWDRNFYDRRVGATVIDAMLTPGTLNDGTKLRYGLGLYAGTYRGLKTVEHGGADPGFLSHWLQFPDQQFSVICFCNTFDINTSAVARQIATIYLADKFQQSPTTPGKPATDDVKRLRVPERELNQAVGMYFDPIDNRVRKLYVKGAKLFFWRAVGNEEELLALGDNRFRMVAYPNVEIVVKPNANRAGKQMHLITNGQKPDIFESVKEVSLTSKQINQFVGRYYSEELDVTYELKSRDGKLLVERTRGLPFPPLAARFEDGFFDEGGSIALRFTRDSRRHISGFLISRGRVRALRFYRINFGVRRPGGALVFDQAWSITKRRQAAARQGGAQIKLKQDLTLLHVDDHFVAGYTAQTQAY
jgi:CubicO group peptidase (beta-lactamase class C family)